MSLIISWNSFLSSYLLSSYRSLQTLFNPPLNILGYDLSVKCPHRKVCWNTWSPAMLLLWDIEPWLCRRAPMPIFSLIPVLLWYKFLMQYFLNFIHYYVITTFFFVLLIYSTNVKVLIIQGCSLYFTFLFTHSWFFH